jgi:hypothetical protein
MSDNSSNNNENNVKKIRRNKKTFYSNERDNILQQLKNLINLNNDNTILLNKLQDNQELKKKLIEITDDIKKYYRCSTWGYFVSVNNGEKGDEITLLRSIFKDHDYKIFSKDIVTEYLGVKKRYTQLFFSKQ